MPLQKSIAMEINTKYNVSNEQLKKAIIHEIEKAQSRSFLLETIKLKEM
jgi:hypothetical protein